MPNKLKCFACRRVQLAAKTFMFQDKQYLTLLQTDNLTFVFDIITKFRFASKSLKDIAASRRYIMVLSDQISATWAEFGTVLRTEFVLQDSLCRA